MRALSFSEYEQISGGLMPTRSDGTGGLSPDLLKPPGGPSEGSYESYGDYDFTDYNYVPWSNQSSCVSAAGYNDCFTDYMGSYLDQDTDLTALGSAVGGALNYSIEQYGAAAIGEASVDASVGAAAAGVGAVYGGAVTIAAVAGWEIGSWIYNKYQVQIDNATETTINFVRKHL